MILVARYLPTLILGILTFFLSFFSFFFPLVVKNRAEERREYGKGQQPNIKAPEPIQIGSLRNTRVAKSFLFRRGKINLIIIIDFMG